MKINVEKWIVHDKENKAYDIISYKILNKQICCEVIDNLPFDLHYTIPENIDYYELDEDDNSMRLGVMLEELYTWYDGEDTQEDIQYYIVAYCPVCGEKIEVNVIREIDKTEEYYNLKNQYEDLHKKWMKCDSKKRGAELERQWREINNKLNNYHKTDTLKIN